jgi:hypothetical protein
MSNFPHRFHHRTARETFLLVVMIDFAVKLSRNIPLYMLVPHHHHYQELSL